MKTTTGRAALAVSGAAALVLSLTACGGGGPAGGADAGEGETEERELGPLDVYFEQLYGEEADPSAGNAQQMEAEEVTAACMREQGFEYIPVDWSAAGGGGGAAPELDVEWGTLEFAEKYGYGATTDPYGDQGGAPAEGEEFVDPNQAAVEAMSESEREAYYAALYGEPPTEEDTTAEGESTEPVEYNWEEAGCSGKAQYEVYQTPEGIEEDEFAALQEDMSAMWESATADPRLTGLNSEWASCMADAGYPGLAAVGDGEQAIYDEVNVLWEDAYGDVDESVEMTEEDYEAIEASIEEERKAITPREIEMAVADFTCRGEIKYDEIQQEVNFEYQQEFVDEHKEDLEAWVESQTSAGKG